MLSQIESPARKQYDDNVLTTLTKIQDTQGDAIERAAMEFADTVVRDGIIYSFGTGHSYSVAVEFFYRAGGMVCCDVIPERTFGVAERLSGYASALLENHPIGSNDLLVIISNSGRNAMPVEMVEEARDRGVLTIAITSVAHSRSVDTRNTALGRLCEIADIVIDNCGVPGDAGVRIGAAEHLSVGPTSTLAGVYIAQAIVVRASEELVSRGVEPPIFTSKNLDEGDSQNEGHLTFFRNRIRGL